MRKVVSNFCENFTFESWQIWNAESTLPKLFIPYKVYQEIETWKNKEYHFDLTKIEWIRIVKIQNEKSVLFFLDLDQGEAGAIVFANEIETDLIILVSLLSSLFLL